MKNKLSNQQIKKIKQAIDEPLELRCINVETTLTFNGSKFKPTSTKFQTIPVIYKNLFITTN